MLTNPHRLSFSGLLLVVVAGCGSEAKLHHVSGEANYDGRPIPAGIIFFDPDPLKGGSGTQGFANITNGRYTTASAGQGVRGGAYVIRVTGYDGKVANEAPLGQPLFDEYEFKKELPAADSELKLDIPKRRPVR